MKKIISLILCVVLLISTLVFTQTTAGAYAAHTQEEAVAWAMAQINQGLDIDGNGNWCVDLIYYYYQYLGQSVLWGDAEKYRFDDKLPAGWTRVYGNYQPGDIGVWKPNYGYTGSAGHVGIITSADSVGFNAVNQKYSNQDFCSENWFRNDVLHSAIRPDFPNGSSSPTSYFTAMWNSDVTETDAKINATIIGTNLETCGFYIGTSTDNMDKRTENVYGYVENIWYTMSADYGTLTPGTTYYYKFFITVNGTEYQSDVQSLTTAGSAPTQPTQPSTQPTQPSTQPTQPSTQNPTVAPTNKPAQTTKPATTAHAHKWVLSKTVNSDCIHMGFHQYICSCGKKNLILIPASGHSYNVIKTTYATYFKAGYETKKCRLCGDVVKKRTEKKLKLKKPVPSYYSYYSTPGKVNVYIIGNMGITHYELRIVGLDNNTYRTKTLKANKYGDIDKNIKLKSGKYIIRVRAIAKKGNKKIKSKACKFKKVTVH